MTTTDEKPLTLPEQEDAPVKEQKPKRAGIFESFRRRQASNLNEPRIGRRQLGPKGALATKYVHENLYVTHEGTWAGYWLKDANWTGLSEGAHDRIMRDGSTRLAELVGHRALFLGTHNPWPVAGMRATLEAQFPDPFVPTNGEPGFADPGADGQLGGEIDMIQRYMIATDARRPFWFVAVRLMRDMVPAEQLPYLLGAPIPEKLAALTEKRRIYERVSAIIAGNGLGGEPVSEQTLAWIYRTFIGISLEKVHVDPTKKLSFEDTIGLDGPVRSIEQPFGAYTKIVGLRNGKKVESCVTVLRAEPFKTIENTEDHEPWLSWSTGLAVAKVETAACFDFVPAESLKRAAVRDRQVQTNQHAHYEEHGMYPPDEVIEGVERAGEIVSELSSRDQTLKFTAIGQVMYAVSAEDPDKLAGKVDAFKRLAESEMGIELVQEFDQWTDVRRFIPGESWNLRNTGPGSKEAMQGYLTVAPVAFLGAGVPHASTAAGDPSGFLLGRIHGSADILFHDPFGGARRNITNSTVLAGSPGSSKSSTMAAIAVFLARAGVQGTMYEAAGTMRPLTLLDSLEGATREIPLTADSPPGILQPHFLVPDPDRADYETQAKYDTARLQVDAERVSLTVTAILQCIDPGILRSRPDFREHIQEVCAEFPSYGTSMREVLAAFNAVDGHGGNDVRRAIARQLKSRASLPDGKLIFPQTDTDDAIIEKLLTNELFTLVSMPGVEAPPKNETDPEKWTPGQLAARPIQTLGNRFAALSIWATSERSWFASDELGITTGGAEHSSYAAFLRRVLYDSRKSNSAILLAAQTVNTLLSIESELTALIGATFLSRTSRENALAALPLLGLEPGNGWEDEAPGYADGEVAYSGFDRKVRRVQIDQAWWTRELVAATHTTPQSPPSTLVTESGTPWI